MTQSQSTNELPTAVDFSHHINLRSRARHPSPLKDIIRFMAVEDMVSLAGGLPHPSFFPFHTVTVTASAPTAENSLCSLELPLEGFLQYGSGSGNAELRAWCREFTQRVHRPAYADWEVLLHPGNTNAWGKVVGLLCEPDDYILCESYTYPSAQAFWIPLGNKAAPVPSDAEGMRADALAQTLREWDDSHPGARQPRVLYLVSVGSNPSGVTMSTKRRQDIYDVCVEHDVIIVEDDPYFFLQYPEYDAGQVAMDGPELVGNDEFLRSLTPSMLHFDHQGRVIRLESFSKTLAPGLRLGYFVANPVFTERLLRATEVETQDPSGLSQALTFRLMQSWGIAGYLGWLQGLSVEYRCRRDSMIDAISQHFRLENAAEGSRALVAHLSDVPIFSFVPPTGGMFIWACFYLSQNSAFRQLRHDENVVDPEQTVADQLWRQFAEAKVLLTPGSYYHPWEGPDKITTNARGATPSTTNFRFSFSMTTKEEMECGIARMARVIRASWKLDQLVG
ncbi:hypothetical protein AtubIFM56815_010348 [Aspergillus tubingensis]|uniref:Aminotransferase class I/classII large domain-containing protein n=2 Tax=Aspergillus tubingensis TaxID=5068 RepID=A0A1L9N9G7_ASPTC|nr:hypothetical protein ASPTUDRAFT_38693 [Aspergillus tubingensis CBS 134.48]GLA86098.1 hypothetical protein AtubIFM56815_010348 [Aspergillus tubingensis]